MKVVQRIASLKKEAKIEPFQEKKNGRTHLNLEVCGEKYALIKNISEIFIILFTMSP